MKEVLLNDIDENTLPKEYGGNGEVKFEPAK